jgi:hypothetical protein
MVEWVSVDKEVPEDGQIVIVTIEYSRSQW